MQIHNRTIGFVRIRERKMTVKHTVLGWTEIHLTSFTNGMRVIATFFFIELNRLDCKAIAFCLSTLFTAHT